MKILLIGRNGQVGFQLQRTLACLGTVIALDRHTKPRADLLDPDSVRLAVLQIRPDVIINAAAYTAVDQAETDVELARQINGVAPGVLAELAKIVGAGLIHYSTDYVFDGTSAVPYREDAATAPTSSYGASKLAGEQAIAAVGVPHLIFRTAWVYDIRGRNFLATMLRLFAERDIVRVVADQHGAPTWARLIAEATADVLLLCRDGNQFAPGGRSGTYHLTSAGETSWFGFAEAIRESAVALGLLSPDAGRPEPITTQEYPTAARRPAYSVLDNTKLQVAFNLCLPDWHSALQLALAQHPALPR